MSERKTEMTDNLSKNGVISCPLPILFVIILYVPSLLFADITYLIDNHGKWGPWSITDPTSLHNLQSEFGWRKKDVDAFAKKMKAIADVIRQADADPKGVDRKITGGIEFIYPYKVREMKQKPYLPVEGYFFINAFSHFISHRGVTLVSKEGPGMMVYVNHLTVGSRKVIDPKFDDGWGIYLEPGTMGEFQGFPVYDTGIIVIKKSAKRLWTPVGKERFIKALIRKTEWEFARNKWKSLEEKGRFLREKLNSLSLSELAAPVYYNKRCGEIADEISCIVDADAPGARMLVTPNYDFFDPDLSRSDIQIIAIRDFADYEKRLKEAAVEREKDERRGKKPRPVDIAVQRQAELIRAVDWNKIADMFMINSDIQSDKK
jgi:hypothetical protein